MRELKIVQQVHGESGDNTVSPMRAERESTTLEQARRAFEIAGLTISAGAIAHAARTIDHLAPVFQYAEPIDTESDPDLFTRQLRQLGRASLPNE